MVWWQEAHLSEPTNSFAVGRTTSVSFLQPMTIANTTAKINAGNNSFFIFEYFKIITKSLFFTIYSHKIKPKQNVVQCLKIRNLYTIKHVDLFVMKMVKVL